jgi:hypothetical protein
MNKRAGKKILKTSELNSFKDLRETKLKCLRAKPRPIFPNKGNKTDNAVKKII